MPDLSASRAYQLLRANIDLWLDENVREQFLKDWVRDYQGPASAR